VFRNKYIKKKSRKTINHILITVDYQKISLYQFAEPPTFLKKLENNYKSYFLIYRGLLSLKFIYILYLNIKSFLNLPRTSVNPRIRLIGKIINNLIIEFEDQSKNKAIITITTIIVNAMLSLLNALYVKLISSFGKT
ncbi:hypothetical protein BpHYR1_033532, partial [Brachionus plicatilis]